MRILITHPVDLPSAELVALFQEVACSTYKYPDYMDNDEKFYDDVIVSWGVILSMPKGTAATLFEFNAIDPAYTDDRIVLMAVGESYWSVTDNDIAQVPAPAINRAPYPTDPTIAVVSTLRYLSEIYRITGVEKVYNWETDAHKALIMELVGCDSPTQKAVEDSLWGDLNASTDTCTEAGTAPNSL